VRSRSKSKNHWQKKTRREEKHVRLIKVPKSPEQLFTQTQPIFPLQKPPCSPDPDSPIHRPYTGGPLDENPMERRTLSFTGTFLFGPVGKYNETCTTHITAAYCLLPKHAISWFGWRGPACLSTTPLLSVTTSPGSNESERRRLQEAGCD